MNNLNSSTPKWWQQPQPAWITILASTLLLSLLFGLWQLAQALPVFGDEDATTATTSQTGGIIPYQGFLTDASGQPLNDTVNIQVQLFNASSGGTSLFGPETHGNVPVTDGLFNIAIGSQTTGGVPSSVWDTASVYAQVTVNGETLSPREPVGIDPALNVTNEKLNLDAFVFSGSSVSDNFPLTGSFQELGQMNLQLDYDAQVIMVVNATLRGEGGRSLISVFDQNDRALCGVDHTSTNVLTASKFCVVNMPAGDYTLTMKGRMASSGQAYFRNYSNVHIIPLAGNQ